jgi:hypothetical protein
MELCLVRSLLIELSRLFGGQGIMNHRMEEFDIIAGERP